MKRVFMRTMIVLTLIAVLFFFTNENGYVAARMQGYKALKVFAHVKSTELTPEFNIYETEHFIIKYTDKDENIVANIGRMFEKAYYITGERYDYYPENKTIVFLYDSQQRLWDYQRSVQGQAVMGLYNIGIIHILSPKAFVDDTEMALGYFEENGPVLHEYVHKVIDDICEGNVELWLTEGLALYEELDVFGVEWAEGYKYDNCFNSTEFRNEFNKLEATKSYRQSLDIVSYLIENHGRYSMMELFKELAKGNDMDTAFEKVYELSLNAFIDWEIWKR
jgi:hypothetical protein